MPCKYRLECRHYLPHCNMCSDDTLTKNYCTEYNNRELDETENTFRKKLTETENAISEFKRIMVKG